MRFKNILTLFFPALALVACTSHPASIIGRWRPVEVDADFIRFNHLSDADLKKMKAEASVLFLEGGKFVGMNGKDTTEKGLYAYDVQQKHLLTTPENGKAIDFTVNELSGDKLVLTNTDQGKMTLKRE